MIAAHYRKKLLKDPDFLTEVKRRLAENEYRPKGFDGMSLAYAAPDGRAYYTWPDLSDVPAVRVKHIERNLIWLDARVTKKTVEEFGEDMTKALATICQENDQNKRWQESTKLGALYNEIILRAAMVIPEDLYYDLAASLVVAEDEDPRGFDEGVHHRKMNMMKAGAREGAAFFLGTPIQRKLLGSLLSSEAGFSELSTSWTMDRERAVIAREVLSSKEGSSTTAASSMTSPSA